MRRVAECMCEVALVASGCLTTVTLSATLRRRFANCFLHVVSLASAGDLGCLFAAETRLSALDVPVLDAASA